MAQRRWTMQHGSVGVWQRLPYGPRDARGARTQVRRLRRAGVRPLVGGLATASALVALAAGWAHV
ncbi:MAG TPA: hypothetical protein VII06_03145 [Chloroflexota bacterium]